MIMFPFNCVNNQFRGRSIDNFETEFINLLETAITLAGQEGETSLYSQYQTGVMPFGRKRSHTNRTRNRSI